MAKRKTRSNKRKPARVQRTNAAKNKDRRRKALGGRKRMSKGAVDRLAQELSSPERMQEEAQKLLKGIEAGEVLTGLRFDYAPALEAAAARAKAEAAKAESPATEEPGSADPPAAFGPIEFGSQLLTEAFRERTIHRLQHLQDQPGALNNTLPFIVGTFFARKDAEREEGKNPLWGALAEATLLEAPLVLWLEEELGKPGGANALRGLAKDGASFLYESYLTFADRTGVYEALGAVLRGIDIRSHLVQTLLAVREPSPIIPLWAALGYPVEVQRAARRSRALARATSTEAADDGPNPEQKGMARDRALVMPMYETAMTEILGVALAEAEQAQGVRRPRALRRAALVAATLLGLEALEEPALHFPLMSAYLKAPEGAALGATEEEVVMIETLCMAPLELTAHTRYIDWLIEQGRTGEAHSFVDAGIEALGELEDLVGRRTTLRAS